MALLLMTTLFISAIIFQSNRSSSMSEQEQEQAVASRSWPVSSTKTDSNFGGNWPIVISTWGFVDAVEMAFSELSSSKDSLSAVVAGCSFCELNPWDCGWSVGFGAKPDSFGEVTLDALIMHGPSHRAGAVGALRNIKNAIGVAKAVMEHTAHSLLVGDGATAFAVDMGFRRESLASPRSAKVHSLWTRNRCQPNSFRTASSNRSCPPFRGDHALNAEAPTVDAFGGRHRGQFGHDTIGMIAIDEDGAMTVGTSTNGLRFKVHGRVGDAAIPGAGAYVEQGVGGAVATGNGDVMMLYAPTRAAVGNLERGMPVQTACDDAMQSVIDGFSHRFEGALICMAADGTFAVSKYMERPFHYVYRDRYVEKAVLRKVH